MALHTPEVSSMLKNTDDNVEFAMDMEEPVCDRSEDDNHQQERYPHGITVVYLGFLTKKTTVGWIIVLNSF